MPNMARKRRDVESALCAEFTLSHSRAVEDSCRKENLRKLPATRRAIGYPSVLAQPFDPKDETQRNRAIRLCIAASVEDLDAAEAMRFGELAILPEDEDVPLSVIEALWAETGGVDEDGADDLVGRLDALSLLQSLDLGARTLRLHDNIIWYLRDKIAAEGWRAAAPARPPNFSGKIVNLLPRSEPLESRCNCLWERTTTTSNCRKRSATHAVSWVGPLST
jgi:hypothetical protein